MSKNLIMLDHSDKDCRSISAMLRGSADGRASAWQSFEDAHPNTSLEELMEKFSTEARYGRIYIKNQHSVLPYKKYITALITFLINDISLAKKVVLAGIALLSLNLLWNGYWVLTGLSIWLAYRLANQTGEHKPASYSSAEISNDNYDDDDYKSTPEAFNQTSSSGSAIWTDYDEHIHNL